MKAEHPLVACRVCWALAAALLMPSLLPAADDVGFDRSVSFRKGDAEIRGLYRFRGSEKTRRSELLLETLDGRLVSVEVTLRLEPLVGSLTRVAVSEPAWWFEVQSWHPRFKAATFAEEITTLAAGEPIVYSVAASSGELGSGRFRVAEDQNRGALMALRELVSAAEIEQAVPAELVELLLALEEIVGPHESLPVDWDFKIGWQVTGLLGPVLRESSAPGGAPQAWEVAAGPRVPPDSLDVEQRELLRRLAAAGLVQATAAQAGDIPSGQ